MREAAACVLFSEVWMPCATFAVLFRCVCVVSVFRLCHSQGASGVSRAHESLKETFMGKT